MWALVTSVRGGVLALALVAGMVAVAPPAHAVGAGVTSVTGGSAPGTISVGFVSTNPALTALWVLPASAAPADCSFGAWITAAGNRPWNWRVVDTFYFVGNVDMFKTSPLEVGSLVAGAEYVVCLADSGSYYGVPVYGFAAGQGGASTPLAAAPDPTFTLTSNSADRGTCWPTVSGLGGSWVQLTASGCAPPVGRGNATLLGWATSPAFPVDRARNQVTVDETFSGVRMIFIPLNGYTLLSGDNTMYPIWSN